MTEAELRKKHAVRVNWSNSTGTLDQLLGGAFCNAPEIEVLSDFVDVMGIDVVEQAWKEICEFTSNQDAQSRYFKPYIEETLKWIKKGVHSSTPEYRQAMREVAERIPADVRLAYRRWLHIPDMPAQM